MVQLMTIERHIAEQQRQFPSATGVLTGVLTDIALAAKVIAREMMHAGLRPTLGSANTQNVHGETQEKLDVIADETLIRVCSDTGRLCFMASEEHEEPIPLTEPFGRYMLFYDPLDGSSNISSNVSTGTIFTIYRHEGANRQPALQEALKPGNQIVAAGYTVYGPSTMFVYSTGHGAYGFTLDPTLGEFLLTHERMTIPEPPKYYSVNQGNEKYWSQGVQRYVHWLQGLEAEPREALSMRYTGSLVMDFHRNLQAGGVFVYPGDVTNPKYAKGKLRLVYEANALAFICEQAGGAASDGVGRILDIAPEMLHQRVPLFIGNTALVEKANEFVARYAPAAEMH